MKLTKEECEKELEILRTTWNEFIGKLFQTLDDTVQELEEQNEFEEGFQQAIDKWKYWREKAVKLEKENELLKRENKALADDNEMKCELNEKLSKEVAELKRMMKTFK